MEYYIGQEMSMYPRPYQLVKNLHPLCCIMLHVDMYIIVYKVITDIIQTECLIHVCLCICQSACLCVHYKRIWPKLLSKLFQLSAMAIS